MSVPGDPATSCACAAAISPIAAATQKRRTTWDILELLIGYGIVFAVIWTPHPLQHWLYFLALAWFAIAITLTFEGWKAMGCCVAGFWRSSWVVGVAVVLAAVAILFASSYHTLHHPGGPEQWVRAFAGYTIWALMQQLLLQGYFLARSLRVIPSPNVAAFLTASVFAIAHLPNPVLTPLTLIWGLIACLVFIHSRNVYPLAIAHAIMGICIAVTIPATVLHNMRVGLGYLQYQPHRLNLSQSDHVAPTDAWVNADAPRN